MPLSLAEFEESLPADGMDQSIEVRARLVLRMLLDRKGPSRSPTTYSASQCPNCGKPYTLPRSPYCSDHCRETAAFVRQFRHGLITGIVTDPERQVALGQTLWHLLGGGRPLRRSIAPPSALKQVFKRTDGKCEVCGAPAMTIDHTGSG